MNILYNCTTVAQVDDEKWSAHISAKTTDANSARE
jgi:hypothetical protein